jgi:serine/threonine protein kinase
MRKILSVFKSHFQLTAAFAGSLIAFNTTSVHATPTPSQYVQGKSFNCLKRYPLKTRVMLIQQFLSGIEHLLEKNIVIDDIRPENIIISNDSTRLTLINLGGNELITDTEMSVGHYLEAIEDMLVSLGGEAAKVLNNCDHLLPESIKNETLSPAHTKILISWIDAVQMELSSFLIL